MHSELEPCPFCGGHRVFVQNAGWEANTFIRCPDCQTTMSLDDWSPRSHKQTVAAWNRREASTQSTGGSEAKPVARGGDEARCEICGEPMPKGEEMFKFHGYSSPCPKPPKMQAYVDEYGATIIHDGKPVKDEDFEETICPPGGSEAVEVKRPHKWVKSTLGHGEQMCEYCKGTNRELAVLGELDHCTAAPPEGIATRDAVIEAMDEALRFITNIDNAHRSVRLLRNALRALRSVSSKDGNHA